MSVHPDLSGIPGEVVHLFEKLTLMLAERGHIRYSARAIVHQIRWHYTVDKGRGDFKCNNNWTPRMARWLMAKHLHMDGFFEIRELRRVYKYDEE